MEQLVGREAELHAVHEALARPAPLGVLLEGEAGIGKTALWRAGVERAAANGLRTLVARPAEAETELSHAALGDLLTPLADDLADEPTVPWVEWLQIGTGNPPTGIVRGVKAG